MELEDILLETECLPNFYAMSYHKPNTLTQEKNTTEGKKDKWILFTYYESQTRIIVNPFNNTMA
jgi:hypothetical protein